LTEGIVEMSLGSSEVGSSSVLIRTKFGVDLIEGSEVLQLDKNKLQAIAAKDKTLIATFVAKYPSSSCKEVKDSRKKKEELLI